MGHRPGAAIAVHHETERVGDRLAVVEHAGGLQLAERGLAAHLSRRKVPVPLDQILDRGIHRPVPGLLPVRERQAEPAGRVLRVGRRLSRNDEIVPVHVPGVGHAEGPEDPLGGEVGERLPAHPLHQNGEQEEAGVAVENLGARLEVGGLLADQNGERIAVVGHGLFFDAAPLQEVDVVPETAGVVQQMPDGDRLRVARDFRQELLDLVVERELSLLRQQHHRHGGELFGDRTDVEDRPGGDRHPQLDAREPVSPGVAQRAVPDDAQGAPGRARDGERCEDRVHPRGVRGPARGDPPERPAGGPTGGGLRGCQQEQKRQRRTRPSKHALASLKSNGCAERESSRMIRGIVPSRSPGNQTHVAPTRRRPRRYGAAALGTVDLKKDRGATRIWMAPLGGGEAIPMTADGSPGSGPRWSPDGRYLGVRAAREGGESQVWTLNRLGGEAEQLTQVKQGIEDFEWSPDGSRLLLTIRDARPERPKAASAGASAPLPIVVDRLQFKRDDEGYLDRRRRHLYVFAVATKTLSPITSGDFDDGDGAWAPAGKLVAFTSNRTE